MDSTRKVLTSNMKKLPSTGIRGIDDVHNFIWELRMQGKPCTSIKLKPLHFEMYVFWLAKMIGYDKLFIDNQLSAPIECDGVQILKGEMNQISYILPSYLPMDDKRVSKYREYEQKFGKLPEHHSQIN